MRIKKFIMALLPALAGLYMLPAYSQNQPLHINNLNVNSGNTLYEDQHIVSPSDVLHPVNITQDAQIDYKASEQVELKPGFKASDFSVNGRFHAFIDPLLTTSVNYDDHLFTEEEFDNREINTSLEVGYIPGSHSVTPTGAATYTIPIQLPPGTAGMMPSLAVSYNSQGGNGILGMGWNVSGLSAISRVPKTLYHNEIVEAVQLDETDNFALDGNRLIKVGDYYYTEAETFSRIRGESVSGSTPQGFEVETKNGQTIYYGYTPDSRFYKENTSEILFWLISKIKDNYGNYIEFKYRNENREVVIDKISYTGNEAAGLAPYNHIQFYYDIRDDKNTTYIAGASINSTLLLKRISITADGQDFKVYRFNYGQNLYSFLKEVQEFGSDGSEVNSTVFKYGNDENIIETIGSNLNTGEDVDIFEGDFNGDGYTDILKANKFLFHNDPDIWGHTGFDMFLNLNGTFVQTPYGHITLDNGNFELRGGGILPGKHNSINSDYNGDGKEDILVIDIGYYDLPVVLYPGFILNKIKIYYSDGIGGFSYSTLYELGYELGISQKKCVYPGDYNGDGATDLLVINPGTGEINFIYPRIGNDLIPVSNTAVLGKMLSASDNVVIDFDGDGKHDLLSIGQLFPCIICEPVGPNDFTDRTTEVYTFNSTDLTDVNIETLYSEFDISPFDAFDYNLPQSPENINEIYLGDFNGDGKTDLLTESADNNDPWYISYSSGESETGFITQVFALNNFDPEHNYIVKTGDYNGDNKSDVLFSYSENHTDLYVSKGNSFEFIQDVTIQDWLSQKMISGDFNGDGNLDELKIEDNNTSESDISLFSKDSKALNLKTIKNGFNQTIDFDYTWLSKGSNYGPGDNQTYPISNFQQAMLVVSAVKLPDGIGEDNITEYSYYEGKSHKRGRGFMGFKNTYATNSTIGITSSSEYEIKTPYYFPVLKQQWNYFQNPLTNISRTTNTVEVVPLDNNQRYWVKTISAFNEDFINDFQTSTDYSYYPDNKGNIYTVSTEYGGAGETSGIQYGEYVTNGSWIPWLPSSVTSSTTRIEDSGTENFTASTLFTYNNHGKPEVEIAFFGLPKSVTTDYEEYDVFGNLKRVKISSTGLTPRTAKFDYESKGRFPIKKYNALDQYEEYSFDPRWGQPLSAKGVDGLIATFEYDGFGGLIKSIDPHGIATTSYNEWTLGDVEYSVFQNRINRPASPQSITVYDAFQRALFNKVEGFGGQDVLNRESYDARGNITTQTSSYYEGGSIAPIVTSYTYDEYNRLVSESNAAGTTSYAYSASDNEATLTITDPAGVWTKRTTDGSGKTIIAEDEGGKLIYEYYATGNLKNTKLNNVLVNSTEEDDYGRQISLTDINTGTSSYTYNAYGELEAQTDALMQTYAMNYDALGRLTFKEKTTGDQHTTAYEYWTNGNGINQVKAITNIYAENGNNITSYQNYNYDAFDRLSQYKEGISGGDEFITGFTYDTNDNLVTQTYPAGFKIKNHYDSNGYLTSIKDDIGGTALFAANETNALGQITSYKLGNNKITQNTYDEFGFLRETQTTGVQNMGFDFNIQSGNLISRTDNLLSLNEQFNYDIINRLTQSQVELYPECVISYSDNGNIEDKCDAGVYTYSNQQINAVTTVTNPVTNISLTSEDVSYTSFRRPALIAEGDYELKLFYGADNHRLKTILNNNGTPERTTHYSLNFERVQIENALNPEDEGIYDVNYIPGANAIAVSKDGGTPELYFIYSDHLGSVLTITDENANPVLSQNFDAWGRNRNPLDWTYDNIPENELPWFNRGFTGHEHLKEFALINMNARLYDPLTGRMLAADNYIQEPAFTQSYNRYSYCVNNPLKFTDPTGDMFWGTDGWIYDPGSGNFNYVNDPNIGTSNAQWIITQGPQTGQMAFGSETGSLFISPIMLSEVSVTPGSSFGSFEPSTYTAATGFSFGSQAPETGTVGATEKDFFDEWSNFQQFYSVSPGIAGAAMVSYGIIDGASVTAQSFFGDYNNARHLNGNSTTEQDRVLSFANTATLFIPSPAKIGGAVKPNGIADDAINLATSSKSIKPSRTYTIFQGNGDLYKFGVTDADLARYMQSLKQAGPGAYGKFSGVMPKYQAHSLEKYLRSLHYNSTGQWRLPGMKVPFPVNFETEVPIRN